jgi:hypothetical protein
VYQLAQRTQAISSGGLSVIHQTANSLGLVKSSDSTLKVLKQPGPYHDCDHVLTIAYNLLCGGLVLDDIEVRRNDVAFLDALGARAIPDPTTAGDYCRRFDEAACGRLMHPVNDVRVEVWRRQPASFRNTTARIDADGSMGPTGGECTAGMDLCHKGIWGYHPLLVSLSNTGEPLFVVNRSGNRPSHDGAPGVLDQAIEPCRRGGFSDILLRGDTDFSMTTHFDRGNDDDVRFVFGFDANAHLVDRAESLPQKEFAQLQRRAAALFAEQSRAKQPRVKDDIVRQREYKNLRLEREDLAEFDHQSARANQSYRMIVVRKTIREERGQGCLDTNYRYFFYVTKDRSLLRSPSRCRSERTRQSGEPDCPAQERCQSPARVGENWAYMIAASLAATLKSVVRIDAADHPGAPLSMRRARPDSRHGVSDLPAESDAATGTGPSLRATHRPAPARLAPSRTPLVSASGYALKEPARRNGARAGSRSPPRPPTPTQKEDHHDEPIIHASFPTVACFPDRAKRLVRRRFALCQAPRVVHLLTGALAGQSLDLV